MRSTYGPVHKALIEVAGRTLLDYNLSALLRSGIDDVVVVVARDEPAIGAYVADSGQRIARRFGARLETFVETEPLGNIGVVGVLGDTDHDLCVVYVDNLTSLSAADLLERHRASSAALTVATHVWPLRNPFGELEISDGFIRAYREKPVRDVRISSGTCVVGPAAAALTPPGRPFGAADLCAAALAAALPVAAYEHAELWIDVNDAQALAAAEALVRANPGRLTP